MHYTFAAVNNVRMPMKQFNSRLQYYCYNTLGKDNNYVFVERCDNLHSLFDYKNLNLLIDSTSAESPQDRIDAGNFNGELH